MTNADWWNGVRRARERHETEHVAQLVWALRKGDHAAVLQLRPVPGVGVDLALLIDGELLKSRLFRSDEQAELGARFPLRGDGWRHAGGSSVRTWRYALSPS
jgi:hypothetical protein